MMKPELARQELGKLASKQHADARMERLKKLPRNTAATALALFGRKPDGTSPDGWEETGKLHAKAAKELVAKPKERATIMAAMFPSLAKELEAGWQVLLRVPYTSGYDRRAFRAPKRPDLYADRQSSWLRDMYDELSTYPDDVLTPEWVAAWAIHLRGYHTFGYFLAGAIEQGATGPQVFEILKDSAASRHEIGGMGVHVTRALLSVNKPEAWEYMEKLLLAAQRQEGLRQAILECVDEAHPEAFQRMVRLLLDENLLRFSSVARAAAVWLGEEESALNQKKLKADLQTLNDLIGNESKRQQAVNKGDVALCHRGLWAMAFHDVDVALEAATGLLKDKKPERRYAGVLMLKNMELPETLSTVVPMLDDGDWRVVALTVETIQASNDDAPKLADLFERLEKLVKRLPDKLPKMKPVGIGWGIDEDFSKQSVASMLVNHIGDRPAERLLPYMPLMDVYDRIAVIRKLTEARTLTGQVRELVMGLVGEQNSALREAGLEALKKCTLAESEAQQLEGYLTRKTADFRRAVYGLLLGRNDAEAFGSVQRLLAAKDANQRLAGVELARQLVDKDRLANKVREELTAYRERNKRMAKAEAEQIEWVLDPNTRPATLADCLGLLTSGTLSTPTPPRKLKVKFTSPAAVALIKSLDDLIHENRTKTFQHKMYDDSVQEVVLGSASQYHFSTPEWDKPADQQRKDWVFADLWQEWWANRGRDARDADGLELLRAIAHPKKQVREGEEDDYWTDDFDDYTNDDDDERPKKTKAEIAAEKELLPAPVKIRYGSVITNVLTWLEWLYPPDNAAEFLVDAAEAALALVPSDVVNRVPKEDDYWYNDWRDRSLYMHWLRLARSFRDCHRTHWNAQLDKRVYGLARWIDEASPDVGRFRTDFNEFYAAFKTGAAGIPDFIDQMLGARTSRRYWGNNFDMVSQYTRDREQFQKSYPEFVDEAERVVTRILEVELARGELPSEASEPALAIQSLVGAPMLFRLLKAFGKNNFSKSSYYNGNEKGKGAVLSHLIRVCMPGKDDTPESFAVLAAEAMKAGDVTPERLLELSCVNPKWVRHIEKAIGWPGLCEAIWWLTAHTSNSWSDEEADEDDEPTTDDDGNDSNEPKQKKKSEWGEIVAARTNLSAEQRADGVVDVAWFHNAYNAVGNAKRWDAIETAAKYLGYGQSSKKAGRLADVLLGVTKKKDLVEGIQKKNLKEYVRLLGLLPLPADAAKRETELLDRHKVLKGYERYARGLSSLSKEPALTAARIGLENLAVTAGYPDPLRLEWAVGAKTVTAMLKGPMSAKVKNIEVKMTMGDFGVPEIEQTKDGKPLKSIPTDVRKNTKVADLLDRRNELKKLAAGNKRSLELAMCQGDTFTGLELVQLMGHPLVKPLIERLVLQAGDVRGYPTEDGKGLRDYKGKVRKIPANTEIIIAHPLDLLAAGDWHDWQAECFRVERLQPFKQVFRELYTLTAQEKEDGTKSSRYAGQQVNENQGNALFGSRGWSTREGVEKIFRVANLVATVNFDYGYTTPAEVEGLTIGTIEFHRRGDWKRMLLSDVPAKIFSEVMRDLDLVVSVAHVGGVDPEASASTVEMRTMLLKEMQTLLKLNNVTFDSKHALIAGSYGQYSVHLGSGVVHKQPGGSLCIVSVHSQHRGRLFLPFADDDPRTAEVVSKVLLLSRDKDIQDPTILEQIAKR